MTSSDDLEYPESQRGRILASAFVDPTVARRQFVGYLKVATFAIPGLVIGAFLFVWVGRPIQGSFLILVSGAALVAIAHRAWLVWPRGHPKGGGILAYQVRAGGVVVQRGRFLPWSAIDGATSEWRAPSKRNAVHDALADHAIDSVKRTIRFTLIDVANRGRNSTATVDLSRTTDDAAFRNLLDVTRSELVARGKSVAGLDLNP